MARTVFLSWQDDTDKKNGHYFLKAVLKEVCEQIQGDTSLDEADRDVMPDSDTQGVPGHTLIIPTILEKIDAASVFVADVTYTGTVAEGSKATPNPNVLLEFGWAWKNKQRNMVSVMNTAFGHPKNVPLPFDLGFARWPTFFHLAESASNKDRELEKSRLVPILKTIILECLKEPSPTTPEFFAQQAKDGISRFRAKSSSLGVTWDPYAPFGLEPSREIFLADGPSIFLRMMPVKAEKRILSATELIAAAIENGRLSLRPLYYGDIRTLRAEDGIAICGTLDGDSRTATVAFAFETSEVWAINTSLLDYTKGDNILPFDAIKTETSDSLTSFRDYFLRLGISGPYKWHAGIEGVRGRRFHTSSSSLIQSFGGHTCLSNEFSVQGTFTDKQDPQVALRPFFDMIYQKCGYPKS